MTDLEFREVLQSALNGEKNTAISRALQKALDTDGDLIAELHKQDLDESYEKVVVEFIRSKMHDGHKIAMVDYSSWIKLTNFSPRVVELDKRSMSGNIYVDFSELVMAISMTDFELLTMVFHRDIDERGLMHIIVVNCKSVMYAKI